MSTIWHIIKKDFRHNRWLLLAMVGVLLAKVLFLKYVFSPEHGGEGFFVSMIRTTIALNGGTLAGIITLYLIPEHRGLGVIFLGAACFADILLLIGIVLRTLKEDSALEERSFWRTLPISRRQMLAAKALFIGSIAFPLIFVLQAVVLNPVFRRYEEYGVQIKAADGLLAAMLIQACSVGIGVLVATLWRNRLIAFGTLLLSAIIWLVLLNSYAESHGYETGYGYEEILFFAIIYTWLAGSAVIGSVMYLKANRAAGFSLFAAMLLIFISLIFLV